jgi:hypothetical protein
MEESQNQNAPKMSSVEEEHEEFEMNHTDKLVGVFSEPGNTFSKIAKFPAKTSDWIIPILILIVVAILSYVVLMNNPAVKASINEKNIARIEKQFNDAVAKGQMTQTQANDQLDKIRDNMGQMGAVQIISTAVGTPIIIFIYFFIVVTYFFVIAKFVLKGNGSYKDAMVAYGLPSYILIIQSIIAVIASLLLSRQMMGLSVAEFTGIEKTTITGFILSKLDIFSIWFYFIFGIALAKLFKSANTKKFLIAVFVSWIGVSFIFWLIAKAVPFLSWLAG